jgi:hypothetical protein
MMGKWLCIMFSVCQICMMFLRLNGWFGVDRRSLHLPKDVREGVETVGGCSSDGRCLIYNLKSVSLYELPDY